MRRSLTAFILAILISTVSLAGMSSAETSGRQLSDVDCSGYTFEDLFDYNHANFDIEILSDWASAEIYANSWVNDSKAAIVRDNIDGLFEGVPGGNNSWLSTDEREAVREIGPKCIADMDTRLGLREGVAHRGGVDWNDLEFVEDGIALDEVNLVPDEHSEERQCQNMFASSECREVPVTATDNLEISMFLKEGETSNMRFNQLPNSGQSNFTLALNATNMTHARLEFTFPAVEGLRMAEYDVQDDGISNLGAATVSEIHLPDGRLKIALDVDYDKTDWPMGRNLFIDLTTMPPETNEAPVWGTAAPVDDTVFPMFVQGNEELIVIGEDLADWASDDNGWSIDCAFDETGWSSRMNGDGDLLAIAGTSESSTATCSLVDPYGENADSTRTWRFGQPLSFSATEGTYGDSVDIEVTPTLLVQSISLDLAATQSGTDGPSSGLNLGSSMATSTLSLSGMAPGSFEIHLTATADGMLDWDAYFDLGLEKENTPPVISVESLIDGTNATWSADYLSFSLSGSVIDPDGGEVSLTAIMCGDSTTGFSQNGVAWDVSLSIAACFTLETVDYTVEIHAQDSDGATAILVINVDDPLENDVVPVPVDPQLDEDGLPALSMIATIVCMLGAALIARRD